MLLKQICAHYCGTQALKVKKKKKKNTWSLKSKHIASHTSKSLRKPLCPKHHKTSEEKSLCKYCSNISEKLLKLANKDLNSQYSMMQLVLWERKRQRVLPQIKKLPKHTWTSWSLYCPKLRDIADTNSQASTFQKSGLLLKSHTIASS